MTPFSLRGHLVAVSSYPRTTEVDWTAVNSGLVSAHDHADDVGSIVMSGANVFAGTLGGIYLSTNSGTSWKMLDGGGWFQCSDQTLALSGTNLFAGSNGSGSLSFYRITGQLGCYQFRLVFKRYRFYLADFIQRGRRHKYLCRNSNWCRVSIQ